MNIKIRPEKGETDCLKVFPAPDNIVVSKLKKYRTRTELFDDLPTELGYNT